MADVKSGVRGDFGKVLHGMRDDREFTINRAGNPVQNAENRRIENFEKFSQNFWSAGVTKIWA